MKTEILKSPQLRCGLIGRASVLAAMAGVASLALSPMLRAGAVLDTLGGGPLQGFPTAAGYQNGNTFQVSQFNYPSGLAFDVAGTTVYLADTTNNAVRKITQVGDSVNSLTTTFANTNSGISRPVAVALDNGNKIYVLNRGNGNNGTVLTYNTSGNMLGAKAGNLINATAIALDGSTNIYVTVQGNAVIRINATSTNIIATITNAGTSLKGIAVLNNGMLALSDAGNHGIWLVNPANGNKSVLTGFNGAGDTFGDPAFAQLRSPEMIAKAGGDILVVADRGNHRVKTVDATGFVANLYGISSDYWVTGPGTFPGWWDGSVCEDDMFGCPEAREPVGVTVAPNGNVYTTEAYYHLFRQVTATGLTGPSGGGGGTNGVSVVAPTLSPNTGYFPMGVTVTVNSPNPDVHFTTDGTEPTQASPAVAMSGNTGFIRWMSTLTDLTSLRVKAFSGTNSSATVSGQPAPTNSVAVPRGLSENLLAGIGSTIVVPVVANLRSNDTVRSYQFSVKITPSAGAPMISDQFRPLSVLSNDFVEVVTSAQGGVMALLNVTGTTEGQTRRLDISALGTNANVFFQKFAVVAMLAVPIPGNAAPGQTYSLAITDSSATSNGIQGSISFPAGPAATILVTNVAYTVGDSAFGGWYNAGDFGNHDLDNSDVNNAFYAAAGLRLPYPFTDVFDAMDSYPEDELGFVGGDGAIRFLDWDLTFRRSLRNAPYTDGTNNWIRAWSFAGDRTNAPTTLVPGGSVGRPAPSPLPAPWERQARIAALPVGNAVPGNQVNVPIYVKTANDASLSGLQFRCLVTPDNGGPALSGSPTFVKAATLNSLTFQQGFKAYEVACGWRLGSVDFGSRSSNYLGTLRFTVPAGAQPGQTYTVAFANADGAPDEATQYTFESKRAAVTVLAAAAPVTDITSDEWKLHFFGSLTAANAGPGADPDLDGVANWAEYVAGTDPNDAASLLQVTSVTSELAGNQRQVTLSWLSAPGKAYEILASSNPTGGGWSVLNSASGDGSVLQYTDNNPGGPRFYRLRVLP